MISDLNKSASITESRLQLTSERLAAVNYLNMFPYFALDEGIEVYPSPRILNEKTIRNEVDAACISAVVGLKNDLRLVTPFMGIGCSSSVQSVYLEPLLRGLSDEIFWSKHLQDIPQRISDFLIFDKADTSLTSHVMLFSHGASEQSEWLFRSLLRLTGSSSNVKFLAVSSETENSAQSEISKALQSAEGPAALLMIGDPALERAYRYQNQWRIDLAAHWRHATGGLPCIFAAWFQSPEKKTPDRMEKAGQRLQENILRWSRLTEKEKRKLAEEFMFRQGARLTETTFDALRYLDEIDLVFHEEHQKTLLLYKKLLKLNI